ncbi:MAG TPA: glycosyltransferase family 2 protein [Clostridiales bacterium]|jgi:glycosyltransferase involved in cell wall biosynthesis|nr:glycosyltransferase family 2 protein [Clostridiales bacterium]
MSTITVVIPTYNEEKNIAECIISCRDIADRILLLDNMSTDQTKEIAESLGAEVFQTERSYKERMAMLGGEIPIDTDWILYMDADERLTPESAKELKVLCDEHADADVNGIVCRYRQRFLGKDLNYGDSVGRKLRVFKPGRAYMEDMELDEHIVLRSGRCVYMKNPFIHLDYKGLEHWIAKHNGYSKRHAKEYMDINLGRKEIKLEGLAGVTKLRRILKFKLYYRLPIGLRAWMYFVYRYYLRLGFLDGRIGKMYIFFKAYWYRYLTDAYILELQNREEGGFEKSKARQEILQH